MLLVFTPCLYCNVSDAWMLPSKWQRAAVSAAGMYVELAVAAVCTFLWWFSEPGLFNSLCLNLMFVASVSTLLFNGNPLLRYDGYYILSDLVEVPNLQQQSTAVVRGAVARWFFGVEPASERMLPDRRRGLLATYAIASTVYRLAVIVGILWFVHAVLKPYRLEVLAQLLAVFIAAGLIVAPLVRVIKFLSHPARSREVKWLRFLVTGGGALAVLIGVLLVPFPHRVAAPVVLEPRAARSVYVTVPGRLVYAAAAQQAVDRGQDPGQTRKPRSGEGDRRAGRPTRPAAVARRQSSQPAAHRRPGRRANSCRRRGSGRYRTSTRRAAARPRPAGDYFAGRRLGFAAAGPPRPNTCRPVAPVVGHAARCRKPRGVSRHRFDIPVWSASPINSNRCWSSIKPTSTWCASANRCACTSDQTPGNVVVGTITEVASIDLEVAPPELIAAGALPLAADKTAPRLLNAAYQARVSLDGHQQPLLMRTSGDAKIIVEPRSLFWRATRYLSRTFRFDL